MRPLLYIALLSPALAGSLSGQESPPLPPSQLEEYRAKIAKSALELQPYRQSQSLKLPGGGTATLINLNPAINAWHLVRLERANGQSVFYHLENRDPARQRFLLDAARPQGLLIAAGRENIHCDLWGGSADPTLEKASTRRTPYVPLCGERLYLRNPTEGHKTSKEWATDFLRNHVWGGEKITSFVRSAFYQDAYLSTSELVSADGESFKRAAGAPPRPLVDPTYDNHYLVAADLGVELEEEEGDKVLAGRWYRAAGLPGVYATALQARLIARELIEAQKGKVNALDEIEQSALVYLIAFDLQRYEMGFAMGTEHPRVDWSDRVQESVRDRSLPGPDGIATIAPLVNTGMLSPARAERALATWTGGFKRYHGAFKRTELGQRNGGSHYGFIENGTVLSKLQPGLATLLILADGRVDMRTWRSEYETELWKIRHARQNGAPIIDHDPTTGLSRVGELVPRASGNWSGSVDGRYRTVRGGICLLERESRRFLVYGYFSGATASAMARVFQACGCRYAMLTDMNALEHTYLAVYQVEGDRLKIQHLVKGMEVLDKKTADQTIPRFVGFADNRDFFFLLRREQP